MLAEKIELHVHGIQTATCHLQPVCVSGNHFLSWEMCNCLLFKNSHAILTTSSSLNERCVDPGEEVEAAFPATTVAEVAAAAVAILSGFLTPEGATRW